MDRTSALAARRFGTGLSPLVPAPSGPQDLLGALAGPDHAAQTWPLGGWQRRVEAALAWGPLRRARREGAEAEAAFKAHRAQMTRDFFSDLGTMVARGAGTRDGLRERLTWFWADHFTVTGQNGILRRTLAAYVEDAIRPHIAGRFEDLLVAAVLHPAMLVYLDQQASVGPNSRFGQRGAGRGLNENLAREVLELHTLGAQGGYTQADVRALAELFTGLGVNRAAEAVFRPGRAEPGAETLLGRTFGGDPARRAHVEQALRYLAQRPETATHLARKLVVHFVADDPPQELVTAVRAAYLASGGALMAVYRALLEHPRAWDPQPQKVHQPFSFLVASLRALGVGGALADAGGRRLRAGVLRPLAAMGQPWLQPPAPDGWPETAAAWITPQGLAARIDWAMTQPERLRPNLPDPRSFVDTALGGLATASTRFAAAAAETRAAGVGLVLASAEFQRR